MGLDTEINELVDGSVRAFIHTACRTGYGHLLVCTHHHHVGADKSIMKREYRMPHSPIGNTLRKVT